MTAVNLSINRDKACIMNQAPLSPFDDDDRFWLESQTEIVHLLSQLAKHRDFMTVYFNHGKDFILTSLLAVDKRSQSLWFDRGGDPQANERLLKSERNRFLGTLDGVKIQFNAGPASVSEFEGRPCFKVALPDHVTKLQRREFYRVETSITNPMTVLIPHHPNGRLRLPLRNLSLGGLCLEINNPEWAFAVGDRYPRCSIELVGGEAIQPSLDVRYINADVRKNDVPYRYMGCRFADLNQPALTQLQRFLVHLERERRALLG